MQSLAGKSCYTQLNCFMNAVKNLIEFSARLDNYSYLYYNDHVRYDHNKDNKDEEVSYEA